MTEDEKIKTSIDEIDRATERANDSIHRALNKALDELRNGNSDIRLVLNDIAYIKRDIGEIKTKLETEYVTRAEFTPIKQGFYGMVAVVLLAFLGAVTALIIHTPK